jgi:hypothetical protein
MYNICSNALKDPLHKGSSFFFFFVCFHFIFECMDYCFT